MSIAQAYVAKKETAEAISCLAGAFGIQRDVILAFSTAENAFISEKVFFM